MELQLALMHCAFYALSAAFLKLMWGTVPSAHVPLSVIHVLISRSISALLYVKLNVLEDGVRSIKACKTRRFPPSISVHLQPDKDNSTLTAHLPPKWENLSCQFSLCTKLTLGKCISFTSPFIIRYYEIRDLLSTNKQTP